MAAKGVIRDVGRVMDIPYARVSEIAKMIPNELKITINKALEMNGEFRRLYENDEQIHFLIDMCKKLEGLPRHTSMHAAGVVICQKSADEFVPLSRGSDGSITTQYTMTTLEELGLLKMDFLGLRTLTVIQNAVRMIKNNTGIELDMDTVAYNDKKVLASIGTGKTDGVFQLESNGMKNFMKELKPQRLDDLIAGISLYRPGPMDFIPKYIRGKNNRDDVKYACKELEPILEDTYGCIVYQEQVMQIVRDLGGYTLGRSDLLRRAMSKKKTDVMEKERENFVHGNIKEGVPGCVARGISEKVATVEGRFEKEKEGIKTFIKYAVEHPHSYNVIWESLYIDKNLFIEYYDGFAKRYEIGLNQSIIDGEMHDVDTELVSYILMGISNFVGLKILLNLGKNNEDIDKIVDQVMEIIKSGIFK
jgi:DNA polymerase-3 subunit alpha